MQIEMTKQEGKIKLEPIETYHQQTRMRDDPKRNETEQETVGFPTLDVFCGARE